MEACRACNNVRGNKEIATQVFRCAKCEAIFGTCYLGDSYSYVLPYFAKAEVAPEQTRYFDFTTLGSNGVGRRHGWFDPNTKLITQVG
jgi:hypothetical protein